MNIEEKNELFMEKYANQPLLDSSDDPYSSQDPEKGGTIKKSTHKKTQDLAVKKLSYVCVICLIFFFIEVIGGWLANSIAIMSDAAHLLSDLLGFIISILSIFISRKSATNEMSYGFHRAEIIGALVSVTLIWGLTIWLLYEATLRIISPPEVEGVIMVIVAVIGFLFNLIMGIVLTYSGIGHSHGGQPCHGHDHSHGNEEHEHEHNHEHHHKNEEHHEHNHNEDEHHHHHHDDIKATNNINVQAAAIHILGDLLQNLGVIIAGAIILFFPNLSIVDPICTYIFSIIVVFTTIKILKNCISVLMEGSPLDYDLETLEEDLKGVQGVVDIHDLHVWSLSLGKNLMTCHLTSDCPQISLKKARRLLKKKYKINHSTLQVEDTTGKHSFHCGHDLHQ